MWKFQKSIKGRMVVDPVQGEFFRESSDNQTPRNLVREAIQNSLDSQAQDTVRIRFTFGTLNPEITREIYTGLAAHLRGTGSGLRNPPAETESLRFLAIEDFGTTGLKGDTDQLVPAEGDHGNDFFYFWRNVGRTGKSGSKFGSWGLGKSVFPASSGINAFFGLTTRESDSGVTYLMGMSVLKNHRVDTTPYDPYGHYAQHQTGYPLPIKEESHVERFREAFHLHRAPGEPGLSVVIPHVVDEFGVDVLKKAVIEQFFWPILSGRLLIEIQEDYLSPPEITIDASALLAMCEGGEVDRELADTIALAHGAISGGTMAEATFTVRYTGNAPKWVELEVPEKVLDELRLASQEFSPIRVRVNMPISHKSGSWSMSHFWALGQHVGYRVRRHSYFVRGGLSIEKACGINPSGFVFVVNVPEDGPLARMLVAAETPSHSEFERTDEIKQGDIQGPMTTIDFVRHAPGEIARMIGEIRQMNDKHLLADVFYKPKKREPKQRSRGSSGATVPIPPPIPDRRPPDYNVTKLTSGFVIRGAVPPRRPIDSLSIKIAYDSVSERNPFNEHRPWDFDLTSMNASGLELKAEKCVVETVGANELRLVDIEDGFRVEVSGFDPIRDVIVFPRARYE